MKKNGEPVPKPIGRRNLFDELAEGMAALAEARQGKRTLPTHTVEPPSKDRD